MQVMKSDLALSHVPEYLKIAATEEEFREIWGLREAEFSKLYPGVSHFKDDHFDGDACVLFSQNTEGHFISTGRIAFDGSMGLPADEVIKPEIDKLREQGLSIAESSKFTITQEARGIFPYYVYSYYEIAAAYNIDSVIFIIRNKNVGLYRKTAGAKVLVNDIGYSYGTSDTFALLECRVQEVIPMIQQHWRKK